MPTTLFFKFSLATHTSARPAGLVVAVDLNRNNRGDAGEFVPLAQSDLTWTGTLTFDHPASPRGLLVMWAFRASAGASFTYEVRNKNADGDLLFKKTSTVVAEEDVRAIML